MKNMINYKEFNSELLETIKLIYEEESWRAYLKDDEKLKRAFDNSLYCYGAFDGESLIGFVRCVGDGEHILCIQDLILRPSYQGKGFGSILITHVLKRYHHVRMITVNTDIHDERDNYFYQKHGFKKLHDFDIIGYVMLNH